MDAFIAGTRIGPDETYRFVQGEEVLVNGAKHKIKRPLRHNRVFYLWISRIPKSLQDWQF